MVIITVNAVYTTQYNYVHSRQSQMLSVLQCIGYRPVLRQANRGPRYVSLHDSLGLTHPRSREVIVIRGF